MVLHTVETCDCFSLPYFFYIVIFYYQLVFYRGSLNYSPVVRKQIEGIFSCAKYNFYFKEVHTGH